jgi:two-component system CheB/CheR fusion protein
MSTPGTVESEEDLVAPQHSKGAVVERDGHSPFPIVGVGASAGGLEAFSHLLGHLPPDTGMAFLLVQHLDPRHESRLTDLLGKTTRMPVLEAAHGLGVRPDHVYVIPPNANMAIASGILHITPRPEGRGPHLPVDYLFRSLAEDQQAKAIGVVLSGTGSDGTLGLCEIKAVGGITFAQEEKSAKHSGMPHSAIDSGCVDFVLTPEQVADRLAEIGCHPYLAPAPPVEAPKEKEAEGDLQFKRILAAVRGVTGVDFTLYRDTTIRRRIMRRMALHGQQSLADYARRLDGDRTEVVALYHDLLINVTSFFRDPELFEALKGRVFPEIIKGKSPTAPVRVWVPGCSSGQEAYSLAMTLLEFYDDKPARPPIQIFATDLSDQTSLEKARAGAYPESIEAEVAPERLCRFFRKEDHLYRIDKTIRDMCVFARQNVTADPPFSHLDLISCRNVLIYLATPLQKRVLPTFHYALNVPGFLVLGTAETVGEHTDMFEQVDRSNKIYSKKATASRALLHFPADDYKGLAAAVGRRHGPAGPRPTPADYQHEADRILLGRYVPPGVLVNENLDIVQFRGRTSAYLEPPPGEPTTNVLKMAREGLFLELRSALTEAKKRRQPIRRESVRVRTDGELREVSLEVVPVKLPGAGEGCFLVMFHEVAPGAPEQPPAAPPARPAPPPTAAGADEREVVHLRQELVATKEYLQSLVEQQDAANEELRSANEEILSSNEELQSTNEELETAKEELQSANEELTTVNEQLQHRNLELAQVNNDLTNVLSSTTIPIVMVGGDLRIRRFTPPAKKALGLLPTDVGRPIGDIKPPLEIPDLEAILGEVIETVQPKEREVRDRDGRWYELRVFPYRTADRKIDGAVIVLVDIDRRKRAEEFVKESDRRKDEFLATLAHELRNPLAPIRNAVEAMHLAGDDPAAVARVRDVLHRQVGLMSRIVDDLLDISRIVKKKIVLRPQRVALAAVVETAVETCRSFIEASRLRLCVELPREPLYLDVDPARLSQVLVNLLNNAAKFTEAGGEITLTAERAEGKSHPASAAGEVVLRVRDTGIGIAPDLLPRVFDMFTQGDRTLERSRGGLGIGLSLVRSLVQMHHGSVEAHSAGPGKGSEFVVRLPLADAGSPAPPTPAADQSAETPKSDPRRILVIDDNQDQAQSLAMVLELMGHEVRLTHDGPGGLEEAAKFVPHVVLLDIGLPGMSGYDVARRIRENPKLKGVLLVAQTGWGQAEDRRRSKEAGFDHHMIKPVDLDILRQILATPKAGR